MNHEEQIDALSSPVEKKYIKIKPGIKGPFTSGDYVRWKLNQVFGPDHWSSMITKGPDLVTLNDNNAYVEAVVRLTVEFADGKVVTHDDVGVWPLVATKDKNGNSVGLDDTSPERYETVLKAVVTDALKACTESLGLCFRPLGDTDLDAIIKGNGNGNKAHVALPTTGTTNAPTNSPPATTTADTPTNSPSATTTADTPTNSPPATTTTSVERVSSTTYYIAATGGKFEFTSEVAREIARLVLGGAPGKNTDFAPAMTALPYFKQAGEDGLELEKAFEIFKDCGMDVEKALAKVCSVYA
ncbi:MAG: hypothetical protein JW908_00725 [Anaerolineales bacterium]|nr:hypothetical protein [Anaerolineales bacterium]